MIRVLLIILIVSVQVSAQKSEWFPAGLNIQPFTANFLEPKAGFIYMTGRSEIRMDIGTSRDIYRYETGTSTFSAGADLFTYTRLRGTEEFHFPVDAVDYLFGVNAGYKAETEGFEYGVRFRLSHISAHLVDGSFEARINGWREGRNPKVYSREYVELMPYINKNGFKVYAGITYLFHVNPNVFGRGIYQLGAEKFFPSLITSYITPFIAYDFKLLKMDSYRGNNILTGGIKFGKYDGGGFSLFFSYYSGKSVHGEYFDLDEKYGSVGFNLDL